MSSELEATTELNSTFPDGIAGTGAVVVRAEEALIVILVLVLWVAAIALFFNRWGKIRMLEPYQPKFQQQHRQSCTMIDPNSLQCLVTGAVLLLATGGGMPIGYSAVLLPQLSEKNNSTLYVDRELGSWIGKNAQILLFFVKKHKSVLVGETAYPGLRGFLVVGSFASYCAGILLVYALGASFNWDVVAFYAIILPIAAFIALCLVPESPAWLVRRKKINEAKKALLWLRGGNVEQMNEEIELLSVSMKVNLTRTPVDTSFKKKISAAISTIRDPGVLKPLIIINVFNTLQLSSGTYVIVFYAVDMVKDIGGGNVDNYLAAVVTAVIRFIFSLVSCVLLLKMGRRVLGIVSALGTALASLILAGYMIARQEGSSVDAYVLAVCLLFYVGANTVGLLTLPGLMTGELMPLRARGIGGGCIFFIFNLLLFFITKCFPWLNSAVGTTGIFIIFGVFALLEAIFIYLALPETKDCSLQEIEDYFQESNILWITRTKAKRRDTNVPVKEEPISFIPLRE
ncbi:facilitated trehalose transporter Tret1-2 homolog [Pogonomyrmex barbatus]|uniref:Facilitated trehalose transporter Tret1-2 homolog n=1 Tax=Pogonomyrmex barbatus TaxID=144034 RepID=A0A6I9WY19_9HYME|nr:facilitated trehalose transporter Tret1-2 homolog [Pogonomyrmex barbatus]